MLAFRFVKRVVLAVALSGCLLFSALSLRFIDANAARPATRSAPSEDELARFVRSGRVIVTFHESGRLSASGVSRSHKLTLATDRVFAYAKEVSTGGQLFVMPSAAPAERHSALLRLHALAESLGIASIEAERRYHIALTPDDPNLGSQWHLGAPTPGNFGINALAAWDIGTGVSSTVIAIVDNGVRFEHPDLGTALLPGYDFVDDVPTANDGTARDNDASDPGDWVTSVESSTNGGFFEGCQVDDSSWHGTHVSGIAAAAGNNATGIAGVAFSARILPVRVLGKCGGWDSDIIDGIRWAAGLSVASVPPNPTPARIINLSLGGAGTCSTSMQQAINDARAAGAVVVTAAGNAGDSANNYTPGNCANVITVAATTQSGDRASFSNSGSIIALSAPGVSMYSTNNSGTTGPGASTYSLGQGTSFAAPVVSGVGALIFSLRPGLTAAQMEDTLRNTASTFPAGSTCSTSICGSGIINALAALNSLPAATPTPASTATPTSTPTPTPTATSTSTPTSTPTPTPTATSTSTPTPTSTSTEASSPPGGNTATQQPATLTPPVASATAQPNITTPATAVPTQQVALTGTPLVSQQTLIHLPLLRR